MIVSAPLPVPYVLRQPKPCCSSSDASGSRLDVVGRAGAVRFAEGMAAGDQRDSFLVVHRHAAEGLANVRRSRDRVGLPLRPLGVHVDEAHGRGAERVLQQADVAELALILMTVRLHVGDQRAFARARRALAVAGVGPEPPLFAAPVDVLIRLPSIGAPPGETERFEAHRLERDVAREDHEIGPGNLAAVLLLDRPQEAARLVEAHVVRPAIERREALLPARAAAAPIADAVGAGAVPGHADEERAVVAEIRGPPVLRIGHERREILLQAGVVEALEFVGVIEVLAHRVGLRRVLVEQLDLQPVRPPVLVGGAAAGGLADRWSHG